MKVYSKTERFYRPDRNANGEISFQVVVEETDLFVTAERDLRAETAELVRTLRGQIKTAGELTPAFLPSLVPVAVPPGSPPVVQDMAWAGRLFNVGPMAAVAGAIAQRVADALAPLSPNVLVENGGDCYFHSTRERHVALLADPESGSALAARLSPEEFPVSLCSSSGRIGHSLSLGVSDLVTVKAKSGAAADAAATALGNLVRGGGDVALAVRRAQELAPLGVLGVFIQCQGRVAVWGEMELAALEG